MLQDIDYHAFDGCDNAKKLIYAEGCTKIIAARLRSIEEVVMPNSATSIEHFAFEDCGNLKSIVIPNSITTIDWHAFRNCYNLNTVTIGSSVTEIDSEAFSNCNVKKLIYADGCTETISTKCRYIEEVVIPNSVCRINNQAFMGFYRLISVQIPNSVTSIGDEAFYSCYSLNSVLIPNSVTSIGNHAFCECSDLTSVVCLATTPPEIKWLSSPFNYSASSTLHVLPGCGDKYRASNWSNYFGNIVEDAME